MNEWGVFGVIVALIGFVTAIVTPLIKLNTLMVQFTDTVEQLTKTVTKVSNDLDALTNRNADSHERIFKQVENHETRITVLEHDSKKGA